jgi:hypothetical protein
MNREPGLSDLASTARKAAVDSANLPTRYVGRILIDNQLKRERGCRFWL